MPKTVPPTHMKKALKLFDVRKWEKDTKTVCLVILGIFLVMSVFAILKPSEAELAEIRKLLDAFSEGTT